MTSLRVLDQVVIKPSKDAKLGIGLTTFTDGTVRISSIAKDSLFAEGQVGMVVEAINGNSKFATSKEAISLLKEAEWLVVISIRARVMVVSDTIQKSSKVPENSESAANDSHGCNDVFIAFRSSKGRKMTPMLCVKLAVCNSGIALYNTVVFFALFGVCFVCCNTILIPDCCETMTGDCFAKMLLSD